MRSRIYPRWLLAAAVSTLAVIAAPVASGAAPSGQAMSWHVGYYTASNQTLSMAQAGAGGMATINFTDQANTALLLSTQGSSGFLGNDLGKTVTATFTIAGADSAFSAYPDQCYPTGEAPNARIYFETSNAGGFQYYHYWWAETYATLANGTFTLSATLLPSSANWGDWDGNADYSDALFTQAASNVTGIGLSFGGYCHYESGVGTADGTGSLTLTSFSVS
jgi:hypothetical protein